MSMLPAVIACSLVTILADDIRVGIIDFHGLRRVRESDARAVLNIREGDLLTMGNGKPPEFSIAEKRLASLPGVVKATVGAVCCDNGRVILYIGIMERGSSPFTFRNAPRDSVKLPDEAVQMGDEFSSALMDAVRRGDAGEDDSDGHALMNDPAARAIQQRFLAYAAANESSLRRVLRRSSDAEHRALAAQIIGYARDKRTVVDDLVYAVGDPSESVRNNAMRALGIIAQYGASRVPPLTVPYEPFFNLLNSPVWTDLNKASMAMADLTESRDPILLRALRARAFDSLVEMARWTSDGHAGAAFWVLGRIGNLPEEAIQAAWDRHDRDAVINAARAAGSAKP